MPSDANEVMVLAEKTNGLSGSDLKPWHLKASYQALNEDGSLKSEGTIEEFWASQTKYKVVYESGGISHTECFTDEGEYIEGGAGMDLAPLFRAQREFVQPLPPLQDGIGGGYVFQQRDTGGIKAACVQRQDDAGHGFGPTWCLDPENVDLRITVNANSQDVLHSHFTIFQGRSVARDLKFSDGELSAIEGDKGALVVHLEELEVLKTIDDADFAPPPNAERVRDIKILGVKGSGPALDEMGKPWQVNISGGVAQGLLQTMVAPIYPAAAKAGRVQGTVILVAKIGKDGHVNDLQAVSGPALLQGAAIDAVNQWTYRPYLLNGNPVEVMTTVNVVFTLGAQPAKP
jgi:TonB family protein